MVDEYYLSDTLSEAESIIAKMDFLMGYPNKATKTNTYATPLEHDSIKGKYLVIIKEVWAPKLDRDTEIMNIKDELSLSEKEKVKTKIDLLRENAFNLEFKE